MNDARDLEKLKEISLKTKIIHVLGRRYGGSADVLELANEIPAHGRSSAEHCATIEAAVFDLIRERVVQRAHDQTDQRNYIGYQIPYELVR